MGLAVNVYSTGLLPLLSSLTSLACFDFILSGYHMGKVFFLPAFFPFSLILRFISVVPCINNSFILLNSISLYGYIIVYSSVDGHQDYFKFRVIANKVTMSILYKVAWGHVFFFFLGNIYKFVLRTWGGGRGGRRVKSTSEVKNERDLF